MPKSGSIDIPHVTVHDHYIRKPITQKDKEACFRMKPLSAEENTFEKQANEKLKELGLIK